jgi:hypothetical protein
MSIAINITSNTHCVLCVLSAKFLKGMHYVVVMSVCLSLSAFHVLNGMR